jgi:sugar transferase EpsL
MSVEENKSRWFVLFPEGMPVRKRLFDLVVLVLTAPVWLFLLALSALIVRVCIGRPLMYYQWRQGYQGRPFRFAKLRTMTDARDAAGELLPDEQRMTRKGTLLRSLSLDEFPQFLLVLQGKMSLVGPRPLPVVYADRYSEYQRRRFEVYPGVTGWAQVNGRNQLSWEERFVKDVEYVEHWSLRWDIQILIQTLLLMVLRTYTRTPGSTLSAPFDPKSKP